MRIPIVFATDKNYLFYTCVAITSLAEHAAKDTTYSIFILMDEETQEAVNWIERLNQTYQKIWVEKVLVDTKALVNATICNNHVTKATFYRLLLDHMLLEEKCIYLDSDIIVTEDLTELYQIELGENYLAGCRDIWIDRMSTEQRENRRLKIGILSMDSYINAGVLVMNLKKIRDDQVQTKFLSHLEKKYPYEDQDILNVCCYGKILRIPQKWNLFTLFMGQIQEMREEGIGEKICQAFIKKSGILHYATPFIRPWERYCCWANKEWWGMASIWKEEKEYQLIKEKVEQLEQQYTWQYYVNRCRRYQKICIFGFTRYGKELCRWVQNIEGNREIYFCDNNKEKQGIQYHGVPVYSLDEIRRKQGTVFFLIASQGKKEEIKDLLLDLGIEEKNILWYQAKTREYYEYLDNRYYQKELEEIAYKEGYCLQKGETAYEAARKWFLLPEYQGWKEIYYLEKWIGKEWEG